MKLQYLLLIVLLFACESNRLESGEGFADVTGGKIWYKVVGDQQKTPIILLHGGPGVPSYYLNPLSGLATDRQVIFYDQLGCGRSGTLTDTTLMTVDKFVDELEDLRKTLGIKEFYLYGSSWGTMLGANYYFKYPGAVKGIIFSSPCLSAKKWTQDADTLIATLPDSIQMIIRTSIDNNDFKNEGYLKAVELYYKNFVIRNPSPDVDSSMSRINTTVYEYMWGPSEFTSTGTLKDYDATPRLGEIKVPTLFIAGEFDEARPITVREYQRLVPGAQFALMKNAGHLTMQDNPAQDIHAIRSFIDSIENK